MQLGSNLDAATNRPVKLRMRPDLIASPRLVGRQIRYVIKDPIALEHHQLWEEEFALLKMLDGHTSFAEIKTQFEARFRPSRLDFSRLEVLLGRFHRSGLVLADRPGQGEQLFKRREHARAGQLWHRFRNLLAIRFRGVNPDRLLTSWCKRLGWCFSTSCLSCLLLFILITFAFVALQWRVWFPRLEELQAYLTPINLIWLAIAFSGLKVIHELGHGLACKYYGGECNEMGVMLLAFAPCLYCDVSDSWIIESKWRRAFVAAAGIWFEMLAAAICAWLWWFSQPGLIHSICFSAMMVGGLGTLFFNANPLLRYDGYFVLSDILESPNLWQQSRDALRSSWQKFFIRKNSRVWADSPSPRSRLMGCYALASMTYQCVVALMILVFVYKFFGLMRLELVGIFIVGVVASATATRFLARINYLVLNLRQLRKGRTSLAIILLVIGLAGISWIPIPASVTVPVLVRVSDAQPVVVVVEGRLIECVNEGTRVARGDAIASLESADLQLEWIVRCGELARQRARLLGLESRRGAEPHIANQIAIVREAVAGLELEVARLAADAERLVIRAPCDGVVLAPTQVIRSTNENEVESWTGTPLEPANRGCFLKRGVQVCQIGSTDSLEGTAYLTQSQVELVEPGQVTATQLNQFPTQKVSGRILEIGSADAGELPDEVLRSGVFPQITKSVGRKSLGPVYVARLSFESPQVKAVANTSGTTRIQVHPRSLLSTLLRLAYETFRLDFTE